MESHTLSPEKLKELKSRQERILQSLARRIREKSLIIEGISWQTPLFKHYDQGNALRYFLKQHQLYEYLDAFPVNPGFSASYSQKTLFHSKSLGCIHILAYLPWASCLQTPPSFPLLSRKEFETQLLSTLIFSKGLQLIVIYSSSGFAPDLLEHQEGSQEGIPYQLYLISDTAQAFWVSGKSSGLRNLFDPEEPDEKIQRLQRNIEKHKKLAVRGGYVPLKELEQEWGIPQFQLRAYLQEILPHLVGFQLEEVRDTSILKRSLR
ncbi:MAG: hypothetical protein AABZ60_25360 [Planctomycetota bacterium]